jgi:hypothetical protein
MTARQLRHGARAAQVAQDWDLLEKHREGQRHAAKVTGVRERGANEVRQPRGSPAEKRVGPQAERQKAGAEVQAEGAKGAEAVAEAANRTPGEQEHLAGLRQRECFEVRQAISRQTKKRAATKQASRQLQSELEEAPPGDKQTQEQRTNINRKRKAVARVNNRSKSREESEDRQGCGVVQSRAGLGSRFLAGPLPQGWLREPIQSS